MRKFEKLMLPTIVVLLIALGWVFFSNSKPRAASLESSVGSATTPDANFDTKRGEMGAVMVEVTPLSSAEYEIVFNTHSVELNFDFTEIIKLKDDLGNSYEAQIWSGEQGGHHLQGNIVFSEIDARAKGVTITILDIEGEVLSFEWPL